MLLFRYSDLICFFSRLTESYGVKAVMKNAEELKKGWYLKKWEELKTAGKQPPTALGQLLDSSFSSMSAEAKKKIIELVVSAPEATDAEVAELTSRAYARVDHTSCECGWSYFSNSTFNLGGIVDYSGEP
jgi:hypothetical protein